MGSSARLSAGTEVIAAMTKAAKRKVNLKRDTSLPKR
jgi:hypothetical protein